MTQTPYPFPIALLAVALVPGGALGCECAPRTAPSQYEGSVDGAPSHKFTWFSDVDKQGGKTYCYERVVVNNHASANLDYKWKIAELENRALPPKERNRVCKVRDEPLEPAANGTLTYGRSNSSTDTKVWKAKSEPRIGETSNIQASSALDTVLEFVFDIGGRIVRNSISVRSVAQRVETSKGQSFSYSYELRNVGKDSPVVSWAVPSLMEAVRNDPKLASFIRPTETGVVLEVKNLVLVPFVDARPPVVNTFPVYFLDPSGKQIAMGSAEAYVQK